MPNSLAASDFTGHVFKAMAEVRAQGSRDSELLSAEQRADLGRLVSAGAALEAAVAGAEGGDLHELRNALCAMRGYAELLGETLSQQHARFLRVLRSLLKAIASASDSDVAPECDARAAVRVQPGTILAVDDTPENLEPLARHLRRMGHRAIAASSGAQALRALERHGIDTVLLDLNMPGMDGAEVLRRIKTEEAWRAIPVIVISGRQDTAGVIACIEAGADDYLFKPFNPVLLQARLKAGLDRKRWHDREMRYRERLERNRRFIRATFGRYVSDEVATKLLDQPEGLELGGDLRMVTILMSDIRHFSSICERLEPPDVMRLLNTYLGAMTDIIMAFGGTVDEFIGDGILAIFGAPVSRDDDAERAVRCALRMQSAVADINREYAAAGLPQISMGVGINTGSVVVGNIGSEKRSKYGIVGHNVNLTSRIEQCTEGGEILASQSTLDRLAPGYRFGRRKVVRVKGIHGKVALRRIIRFNGAGGDG